MPVLRLACAGGNDGYDEGIPQRMRMVWFARRWSQTGRLVAKGDYSKRVFFNARWVGGALFLVFVHSFQQCIIVRVVCGLDTSNSTICQRPSVDPVSFLAARWYPGGTRISKRRRPFSNGRQHYSMLGRVRINCPFARASTAAWL